MTCNKQERPTEPAVQVHESEVGRLKRRIAILEDELRGWRDAYPDHKWHQQSQVFVVNGIEQWIG